MVDPSEIIQAEILGMRLNLRGGEHPEEVQEIVNFVSARVREFEERMPTAPPLQIALMTAINMADDLIAQNKKSDTTLELATRKASEILERVSTQENS